MSPSQQTLDLPGCPGSTLFVVRSMDVLQNIDGVFSGYRLVAGRKVLLLIILFLWEPFYCLEWERK